MGIKFNPFTGQFDITGTSGGGGGGGDVNGPGSSTDNAIARFDGTGGQTLQNSNATIDDSGNILSSNGSQNLGDSSGHHFSNLFVDVIKTQTGQTILDVGGDTAFDLSGGPSADLNARELFDSTGQLSLAYQDRKLYNSSNQESLNYSGSDIVVSKNIIPANDNDTTAGSPTNNFAAVYAYAFANGIEGTSVAFQSSDSGSAAATGGVTFKSGNGGGTGASGLADFKSGDSSTSSTGFATLGSGDAATTSGDTIIKVGTGSTRGKLKLQNGSEGTAGQVWTSTDTQGSGAWAAASGGANTALSNLGATAVNADIIPVSTAGSINLGSASKIFNILNVATVQLRNGSNTDRGTLDVELTSPSGVSTASAHQGPNTDATQVGLWSHSTSNGGSNPSGNTLIETGNRTAGTGASGDIKLQTGTSAGGARGKISLDGIYIDVTSKNIKNVLDPVSNQDAATKAYVDAGLAALNPAQSVRAATTANIVGTYLNGIAGIGATFTTTATGTFTVDGFTPVLFDRILIKNQSTGFQNGIYTITTLGTIGVQTVFTRALDYNTPNDINTGGLIPVINGTVNALSSWDEIATITTIGTDALVFSEFTANPSLYLLKANNLSDVSSDSASFDNISPMTTGGDIIYGGVSGTGTRLPNGSSGQILTSNGGTSAPSWETSGISSGTNDPTQVATAGSPGSLYTKTTSPFGVYQKLDSGTSTNWLLVAGGIVDTLTLTGLDTSFGGNTTGPVRSITINDLTGIKYLVSGDTNGAGTRASGLSDTGVAGNSAIPYQVPGGKSLRLYQVTFQNNSGTSVFIGYADNAPSIGYFDEASLVNPVYFGPSPAELDAATDGAFSSGVLFAAEAIVPTGKYLFVEKAIAGGNQPPFQIVAREY